MTGRFGPGCCCGCPYGYYDPYGDGYVGAFGRCMQVQPNGGGPWIKPSDPVILLADYLTNPPTYPGFTAALRNCKVIVSEYTGVLSNGTFGASPWFPMEVLNDIKQWVLAGGRLLLIGEWYFSKFSTWPVGKQPNDVLTGLGSTIRIAANRCYDDGCQIEQHLCRPGEILIANNLPTGLYTAATAEVTGGDGVAFYVPAGIGCQLSVAGYTTPSNPNAACVAYERIGCGWVFVSGDANNWWSPTCSIFPPNAGCAFLERLCKWSNEDLRQGTGLPPTDATCTDQPPPPPPTGIGWYCVLRDKRVGPECVYYESRPVGVIQIYSGPHETSSCANSCNAQPGWYCVRDGKNLPPLCRYYTGWPTGVYAVLGGPWLTYNECVASPCRIDGWYCVQLTAGSPKDCVYFDDDPTGTVFRVYGGPYPTIDGCLLNCTV